ncbi:MAG: transketolase [Desulfohalobiaceae bacterium]
MVSRKKLADAIRILSLDAIQKAKSGHPGAPMGMADLVQVLWCEFLRHNPLDPSWPDRDRFVLSNGHASMLLYSLLHLSGYDLSMQEIKNFRQLHSKTPGHPEASLTPGVETTTGPLGQGLANAVGMALAERILATRFNQPELPIVDHYTYALVGDGCLMEGISHEACSLAGTLGLGKLIVLYDDNGISIDGEVRGWFSEDVPRRFEAYGWHVLTTVDGHDPQAVHQALQSARTEHARPSLICCQTRIACGSPNMCGSPKTHGSPLGEEEIQVTREHLDWEYAPFEIPKEIYQAFDARPNGQELQESWSRRFSEYQERYPELAQEFQRQSAGELPQELSSRMRELAQEIGGQGQELATRKASKQVLDVLGPLLPELLGGSADLSGSNQTMWSGAKTVRAGDFSGNYVHFGVREFAMVGMMNGVALHGGLIPYSGTFLVFSDYARSAIRLAALMGLRNIFVLSHDSIGVGEDGPTHQPVEQASSLRLIPNLTVWRPCDAVETTVAWQQALQNSQGPSALLLSRQGLKIQARSEQAQGNICRGGYVLFQEKAKLQVVLIATGSEVEPAVQAAQELENKNLGVRVVSMPCVEVFQAQDKQYQEEVLPSRIKTRVVVEAGVTAVWHQFAGSEGRVLGLDRFGESAPAGELFNYFGLNQERIVAEVQDMLAS